VEGTKSTKGKPFLRWAGGKNWLVKDIRKFLPKTGINKYIEPFLGGGSIFFHLAPKQAILSDLNQELIQAYETLKSDVAAVILELRKYQNTKEFYYLIRDKNPTNEIDKAARFIYLNQTSFNGIYRVNLKGKYNVPYGYRKKEFLQPENLIQASKILQNAELYSRDFESCISDIEENDFVFLDPPYTVTHNNNGFIKYNAKLFDIQEQNRLAAFIDEIHNKKAFYVLTNAAHHEVRKIFTRPNNNKIVEASRASLVGGKKAKRGKFAEFIITNVNFDG